MRLLALIDGCHQGSTCIRLYYCCRFFVVRWECRKQQQRQMLQHRVIHIVAYRECERATLGFFKCSTFVRMDFLTLHNLHDGNIARVHITYRGLYNGNLTSCFNVLPQQQVMISTAQGRYISTQHLCGIPGN